MWYTDIDYKDIVKQLKTKGYATFLGTPQNKFTYSRKELFKTVNNKISFKQGEYAAGYIDRMDNPDKDNKIFFHIPHDWKNEAEAIQLQNHIIKIADYKGLWEIQDVMTQLHNFAGFVINHLEIKDKYAWYAGIEILRFLKYTPTDGHCKAAAHTDRAGLTVIIQSQPGLQCFNIETQEWDKVPIGVGVVMVGDALAKEVDDLTATQHRVNLKTDSPRYSTVFFYDKEARE